jgi:hypothetical protein
LRKPRSGGASGASRRLRQEDGFYRTSNEGHRKHIAAMNVAVGSVGIAASQRSDTLEALAPYHSALDLPIVRVLADGDAPRFAPLPTRQVRYLAGTADRRGGKSVTRSSAST